jgi:hypothetical protein
MRTILRYILCVAILTISIQASENYSSVKPYISFNKLNEELYSAQNKEIILGLGIKVKSNKNTHFILALESDIYNETKGRFEITPLRKEGLFLNGGALSYKFVHRF